MFSLMELSSLLLALSLASTVSCDTSIAERSALTRRSEDCDWAQFFWADVDCYYDFYNQGPGWLNYVVRIEPTGQSNADSGWCKGIIDNIIGQCGRNPSDMNYLGGYDWKGCSSWLDYNLHHPETGEVRLMEGLDLNFHYNWPWTEGEDATNCIGEAIRLASCAGGITFKNGGCYKRYNF